jgi:hypothetical protein
MPADKISFPLRTANKKEELMAKEKRQHPRVNISWPATIVTSHGLVECKTENLSPVGTLIHCSESSGLPNNFRLVFKPAGRRLILATAEKVWSKNFNSKNSTSHAVGVRFTFVPDHDYQLIKGTVYGGTAEVIEGLRLKAQGAR